jgi:ATP-binding cassette, subfamily B, multidrug efflux pump
MVDSRLRRLLTYLRPYWRKVLLGILSLLIANALRAYIPLLIRDGIDQIQVMFSFSQTLHYVVLILVFASLQWGIGIISRSLLFWAALQVEFDLKQKFFEHLLTLDASFFTANTAGDLINRATSDVNKIRRLLVFIFLSLTNTAFAFAFTLPIMLSLNMRLSLLIILIFLFLPLLVHLLRGKLNTEQHIIQKELSNLSALIQEDISGISLVKIYVQENNERHAFRQLNQKLLKANLKLAKLQNILLPTVRALGGFCLVILMWLGFSEIVINSSSTSNFIALILYVESLISPTALMGIAIAVYQTGKVSLDRVEAILTATPQIQDLPNAIPLPRQQVKGLLTANRLNFTYPGSTTPTLKDINFTIESGETVAIIGSISSGKSTLANALPHLLNIEPGQLFLDDIDITKLRLQDLRAAIACVPQETFLFSTTIEENIRYGVPLVEQAEVKKAAMLAEIHDEILDFPDKYKTLVGERGIRLSGGQRLRISIARSMLINAPIIIFDNALSSIDNQVATKILKNLIKSTKHKTIIFITHQMSVATIADRIFVIEQGQIVQCGVHSELLCQSGFYRSLWNQQKLEERMRPLID